MNASLQLGERHWMTAGLLGELGLGKPLLLAELLEAAREAGRQPALAETTAPRKPRQHLTHFDGRAEVTYPWMEMRFRTS